MHTCHARPVSQTNVLVDKDGVPHLAGLGNAYILPTSTAWTMARRTGTDCTHGPELTVPGMSPGCADSTHPTKAVDMYAFGVMAFEVWIDSF
jgi:serine/threonine protein kinase